VNIRLVTNTNQIIRQPLHDLRSFTRLSLLIVNTDQNSLFRLDGDHTAGSFLAVDGSVVGAEGNVFFAGDEETVGTDGRGVFEGFC
jgi:hypothetical protein